MIKLVKMATINLSVNNRIASVGIQKGAKKVKFDVSRSDCKDVLCEIVDQHGVAKGKPLSKIIPEIKLKGEEKEIRFTMNNFSTKPITIYLIFS